MSRRLHTVCGRTVSVNIIQKKYQSIWSHVKLAPMDDATALTLEYHKCKNKKKVNLTVAKYLDDSGNSYVLPSVQKAEKLIHSMNLNKEYLPILGESKFSRICIKCGLGDESEFMNNGLAISVHTLGGSGALRLGFTIIKKFFDGKHTVFIPNPSWKHHERLVKCVDLELGTYKYYDPTTKDLDFNGLLEDIKKMPDRSVILLHACAHDPTGMDPSHLQWDQLSALIKHKNMLAFFDMHYQGLASGDPEHDSYSVRKFVKDGNKIMIAVSFSKTMGLYGERTGCLTLLVDTKDEATKLQSQMKMTIRGLYSSPPINGARVMIQIVEDPGLRADWRSECREMADRMIAVRRAFKQAMLQLGSKVNWDHFERSVGMTTICGLSVEQIERLRKEHSVFITPDGRMCVGALNSKNLDYVSRSFYDVTK